MKVLLVYLNRDRIVARGPGYIAAAVLRAGHELVFVDTAYEPAEAAAARAAGCDVLMISASTLFYGDAARLARAAKAAGCPVALLGGVHCTLASATVLDECPEIDYLCVGEGEEFVVEFLAKLGTDELQHVRNLVHRSSDGRATGNSIRECTDLTGLPPFPFDLFPAESVVRDYPLPGFAYVSATRGCPYSCSYCCNGRYLKMYGASYLRRASIDTVVAELQHLTSRYGAKMFFFGDEMILFDKTYCAELFGRLKRELDSPYGCMARVETIDGNIVDLFRRTGCRYVGLGIECGDERFRREVLNRRMSNDQIVEAFRALRAVPDIVLTSYNMQGYPVPFDDELTRKTVELNERIRPDIMQMTVFYPFPGTALHDYCVDRDLIDPARVAVVTDVFEGSVLRGKTVAGYARRFSR